MRIGMGYDVHPLVENRELVLGGIPIPHETGLSGHSDADVLIHAVIDALLGAAALGTIGDHFPDTDEKYKNIYSVKLLEETGNLLREHGARIGNIDCIVVTEKPKLLPYLTAMRDKMAGALQIHPGQVSVKAKREEGLGFTGRREGIKAYAVALIEDGRT
ncbi:MAG: 2-C-methyl-D-erythritol 2,4-cyclodiphosphate synthase [Candidatus Wallbacteria bacterium]|nr:2-C-methyl-D-erythritol 2,4-cyclodiphosphate synthase [Candidatus Wallbacteria bacterium]